MTARAWPWALAAGTLGWVTFIILQHSGMKITPDGWVFWQGAVSIAEGHGYRYFSGDPVMSWPPLYPLYLAAWTWAAGPTSPVITYANGCLIFAQAALWTWCAFAWWGRTEPAPSRLARAITVIYLGLFLPFWQTVVRTEPLFYALLPLFLVAAWRTADAQSDRLFRTAAICGAAGALLVATHHRGAIFVGSVSTLLIAHAWRSTERRRRFAAAAIVAGVPIVSWLAIRAALNQWDSHEIGSGREVPMNYLRQFVHSTGDLLSAQSISPRIAIALFAIAMVVVIRRRIGLVPIVTAALLAAITGLLTLVSFVTVRLDDDIDPRFVLFIPILLVPLLLLASARFRIWATAMAAAAAIVPLLFGIGGAIQASARVDPADPGEIVLHPTRISPAYSGPRVFAGGEWLDTPMPSREPDDDQRRRATLKR